MPQRTLRPAIRQSRRWNRLQYFEQTLYLRLITLVDDYGRYDADPELLRSECFPFGDPDGNVIPLPTFDSGVLTLASKEMLILYSDGEHRYLQLLRWKERTRAESRWPDPKTCTLLSFANICQQMHASPSPSPSPPTPTLSPTSPVTSTPNNDDGKSVRVDVNKLIPDKRARTTGDGSTVMDLTQRLNGLYHRPESDPWTYEEQHMCATIARRPNWPDEWKTLEEFRRSLREKRWFPQSIIALLNGWTAQLDKARLGKKHPSIRGEYR